MEQISVMEHICASRLTCSCPAEDGVCEYKQMPHSIAHVKIYCSPEAVNVSNMAALIDAEGKPHFKYIVEGANLFLTQQARLHLEKRKVVLFKDSSANKGKSITVFLLHQLKKIPRRRDELLTRGSCWSGAFHSRIRRPHDIQRWKTIRVLQELRA
jgi:hypothetical protein